MPSQVASQPQTTSFQPSMQQQRFEADMQTGYGGSADQAAHPAYPSGTTTPVQQPEMSQVDVQFG